ncbi:GNAT family N-acetyltransferase [Streptomyces indicus]|uniref:Acetyltransferase (GNAT) family protein n=1 Tax=Streptomyces indicus TaxID=417292 RepID=A0A1G9ILM8_9ACTN|nr:GNAT family N-acetyltransferase [Streptomyces indicus]SDL25784.1 Acetyltransferase (GNAT) family protein [Streptomyces indicus]
MITARLATPEDAPELVRLRKLMLDEYLGAQEDTAWMPVAEKMLRTKLVGEEGQLAAAVVERPDTPGRLAACAVGTVEYRLGGAENPLGLAGYVFSVATEPEMRRRGYSRACMQELIAWFRRRGVRKVDLRASAEGEPLYASLGFVRTPDPAMRLSL